MAYRLAFIERCSPYRSALRTAWSIARRRRENAVQGNLPRQLYEKGASVGRRVTQRVAKLLSRMKSFFQNIRAETGKGFRLMVEVWFRLCEGSAVSAPLRG